MNELKGKGRLIVALDVPTVEEALALVTELVGASTDDHKRHTTPGEAIRLGADYLVVGRPIRNAANPREAAEMIIAEIDTALDGRPGGQSGDGPNQSSVSALF